MSRRQSRLSFRRVRILVLLAVLATVALLSWLQHEALESWARTIPVTIYTLDGDGRPETGTYIRQLTANDFAVVERFFEREARYYRLPLAHPLQLTAGGQIPHLPPPPPADRTRRLAVAWWSLKMRYWTFRQTGATGLGAPHVRVFVIYQQGGGDRPPHRSYGLAKGMAAVVYAYARPDQAPQNNVVLAHELLHTFGASDKYDADGLPRYPDGYAEPDKQPLYPQDFAEIMGGRIPVSPTQADMPASLYECVIGPLTATEISWR